MVATFRSAHPFAPFANLNQLDSLFDRLVRGDGDTSRAPSPGRALPFSLWQDDNAVYLEAELPGVVENDLEITVHDGVLTVKAEKKDQDGRKYLHRGRVFGTFEHAITLPEQVDSQKVEASMTNGVLSIVLPKVAQALPRKIVLKSS